MFTCKRSISLFTLLFIVLFTTDTYAQSKITFNLNLKPQLEDSTFIPQTDIVEIIGDLSPLGRNRRLRLRDLEPVDSVYTVEIDFPRRFRNSTLTFNYIITTQLNGVFRESLPRTLALRPGQVELEAFYFNAFAW